MPVTEQRSLVNQLKWPHRRLEAMPRVPGVSRQIARAPSQRRTEFRVRGCRERQIEDHSTRITRLRVTTQIGTATGTNGAHILTTVTSLCSSTASGTDSTRGITIPTMATAITPMTTPTGTRTITTITTSIRPTAITITALTHIAITTAMLLQVSP